MDVFKELKQALTVRGLEHRDVGVACFEVANGDAFVLKLYGVASIDTKAYRSAPVMRRRTLTAEISVSQLADAYAMFFAAVQKHVAVLEDARLAAKKARGRGRMVRGSRTYLTSPAPT